MGVENSRALNVYVIDCRVEVSPVHSHPPLFPSCNEPPNQFSLDAKPRRGSLHDSLRDYIESPKRIGASVAVATEARGGVEPEWGMVSQCQGTPSRVLEQLVA